MRHCDKKAVTVNVTNRCNLRCVYCMASSAKEQNNPKDIDIDFALKGISDAIKGYPTGIPATILRFFSPGEPTQRMDIIRTCVEYAKLLNKNIKVEIQTNGVFESKEDLEWIKDNVDVVWFSLDGWAEINDANRPDANGVGRTSDAEQNMKYLQYAGVFVGVRSTINGDMFYRQTELVEYYNKLGIKYICLNPITVPVVRGDTKKRTVYKDNIMDWAKGFADAFEVAESLGCVLSSSLTFNFDEKTNVSCRACLPMPQLNCDGSVSSCDKATYRDTKKGLDCFLYGEWDKETRTIVYDMEKIDYLRNRIVENMPKCRNCSVADYCAGNCAGRIAYESGDIYEVIDEHCDAIKYLASRLPLGRQIVEFTHP